MARGKFSKTGGRPRWGVIAVIALAHLAGIYGLALVFAPDLTRSVQQSVGSALTVTITTSPEEEVRPSEPQSDEGAQGDAGEEATPKPITAPSPKISVASPSPAPRASSTGQANRSGARESGEETGAQGSGPGTGSGRQGGGKGGVAVTEPVHISGTIDSALDYPIPSGGRAARIGTQVIVRVIVGVNGRARNCSIYQASSHPESDNITCQLVVERLRFEPAKDANGRPIAAPFYWRQRWFS